MTKTLCAEVMKRGTFKPIMCTICSYKKRCDHLDEQENHESSFEYGHAARGEE